MRLRFFVSIFVVLVLTVTAVSVVHFNFFRTERMRLVDQQIQGIASSLISNLSVVEFEDMEEAEDVIAETLGNDRIRMVILIRSEKGELFYRNRNAQILDSVPPLKPQWQTLKVDGHTVRLLNLPLNDENWILQVGLVLDQGQVHWRTVSYSVIFYIGLIVFFMLIGAFFLTSVLLRPLRVLAAYLKHLAESQNSMAMGPEGVAPMPPLLGVENRGKFPARFGARTDEFVDLVSAVRSLNVKMNAQFQATQAWTAQMAHELKTPLTIIRNCLETAQLNVGAAADPALKEAQLEIDHLGRVITGFLEWIRLEKSAVPSQDLHALHMASFASEIVARLNKLNKNRIRLVSEFDATVFAKPELLKQVMTNLLQNALQYSPGAEPVQLTLKKDRISVADRGGGLPANVLGKIGQPFNWGHENYAAPSASSLSARGSGLGLAWVKTICDKYGWDLDIHSTDQGTEVSVIFETA